MDAPVVPGQTHPRKQEIIKDALPRVLQGHRLADIAKDHGVSKQSLNAWLVGLGDEYQEIRQQYIEYKLATSEEMLVDADDALSLARARELMRHSQWLAERRARAQYGVQPLAHAGGDV